MTTTGQPDPRRKADLPPLRRLSRNVLIIGTVVALTAAFGPVWATRLGVVVAVLAAIIACLAAWRELAEARHRHAGEMLQTVRAHGAVLKEERHNNALVVDILSGRLKVSAVELEHHRTTVGKQQVIITEQARTIKGQVARIDKQSGTIAEQHTTIAGQQETIQDANDLIAALRAESGKLRSRISTLAAEVAALGEERVAAAEQIRQHNSRIAALTNTLRAREAELSELTDVSPQVQSLPRRALAAHDAGVPVAQQDESDDGLGPNRRSPSVQELADIAVVLPNYEGERKLA